MNARVWFLMVVVCGVCVTAAAADPYQRAERLAAERRFQDAEAEYRRQLQNRPRDWRLRLGLARVILWDERYREAEREFARLIEDRPRDAEALLGHAQVSYWSGDFRAAESRYRRLLAAHPKHAEAQKVLADLRALSDPRFEIGASHRFDSQPYRISGARTVLSWFADPLTRIDVRARAGQVRGGDEPLAGIGAGAAVGLPRLRMNVEAWAERFRFADGEGELIGELSLSRQLPLQSAIVAAVERIPLLGTASSVDAHATATEYRLSWRRDPTERWLAAASIHSLDYSDGNHGFGADAWAIAPVATFGAVTVRGGLSGAWRDTDENRFQFTAFESRQLGAAEWRYTFSGVYAPYWTPHRLREGRIVVVAESSRFKIHVDGGVARDEYLGFGPRTGTTPSPTFIVPRMLEREFNPWRASAEATWPLMAGMGVRARYTHDVSAFYRANEIEASLVGRF